MSVFKLRCACKDGAGRRTDLAGKITHFVGTSTGLASLPANLLSILTGFIRAQTGVAGKPTNFGSAPTALVGVSTGLVGTLLQPQNRKHTTSRFREAYFLNGQKHEPEQII